MYHAAIIEDDARSAKELTGFLQRYTREKKVEFQVRSFGNAASFLDGYTPQWDIVFMDIQLPGINGMDAARQLRKLDESVLLVFITNLAQYAIQGYEVSAADYILKPVSYYDFSLKMARILRRLAQAEPSAEVVLDTRDGTVRIPVREIRYIESRNHHLIYHLGRQGQETTFTQYASMASIVEKMEAYDFARCNNCYLVNLRYVQKIKGYMVTVDGLELSISQPRKKDFVNCFLAYAERKLK